MSASDAAESSGPATTHNPILAVFLAWIVPGAGHLYLRKWPRALSFFCIVLVSLMIGCMLEGRLYTAVADQPLSRLATLACMGMGAPYFVARYLFEYAGSVTAAGYEYGSAFIVTAGLMNLLVVLDAWDIARGVKE